MLQTRAATQASENGFARVVHREVLLLFAVVGLGVLLWWQPLSSTFKLALGSEGHTHILLILPVTVALIVLRRHSVPVISNGGIWLGWLLIATASLIRGVTVWSSHAGVHNDLSLAMFGLVVWCFGSVILIFGIPMCRFLFFPLCFLFLMVPFPQRSLDWITGFLQHQSAVGAELLFRAASVPVTRDGTSLSIPGLELEVAPECSSIRSSMMLLVIVLVLAYLFLQTFWRRAVLVLVAIPLSVAKNAVRIFTIAQLTTRVDPAYLHGWLHRQGGIVFLGLALILEIALVYLLRKLELRGTYLPGERT